MNIAYLRISDAGIVEDKFKIIKIRYIDKLYVDRAGIKDKKPKLNILLDNLSYGDNLYIFSLSEIASSMVELFKVLSILEEKKVNLVLIDYGISILNINMGMFMSTISIINSFEKDSWREKQKEGIYMAKKRGMYKGRKPLVIEKIDF